MRRANPFERFLTAEDRLQIAVLTYLALQYPKALVHHSPNEGKRSPFEQFKIKKLGLKKGFPDLLIVYNGRNLALELKTEKGVVTPEQKEWLQQLELQGWEAAIAYGFDQAKEAIDKFCLRKTTNGKDNTAEPVYK